MKTKQFFIVLLAAVLSLNLNGMLVLADNFENTGFALAGEKEVPYLNGTLFYFKHIRTGAQVVYLDDGSENKEFSIGFKTPPSDNKGANHVLEHSLLCGSEKYPAKNLMHYVRGAALAQEINAQTADDCTYYTIKTENDTEYYNLMDIYMNGVLHPLLLREENIFRQQGIRREYGSNGVQYNGVVYNELRIRSLESTENSVNFLADKLYTGIYGNTTPAFNSGGTLDGIKELAYQDLLQVYNTYYTPANSMIFLSGKQDIHKTLGILHEFLKEYEKKETPLSFPDTKRKPERERYEYNITPDTKTVDIGFLSSGVPMAADCKELYARDILFNILSERMGKRNAKNYVSGGNTGGISNLALLVTEVPLEKKEEIINGYQDILKEMEAGIEQSELDAQIDETVLQRKDPYLYDTALMVFQGMIYTEDPFYYTDFSQTADDLKTHPEYFTAVLKKYFTQNPCTVVVVCGNGIKNPETGMVSVTPEEAEQIKQMTAAFEKWADTPDSPDVIAKIPSLTLDEVRTPPDYIETALETIGKVPCYVTADENRSGTYTCLYFPLEIQKEAWNDATLLCVFLTRQLEKAGLSGVTLDIAPMEDYHDPEIIHPQLGVSISAPAEETGIRLQAVFDYLNSGTWAEEPELSAYLETAAADILSNGYRDPYHVSYDLMLSAQSGEKRLSAMSRGSIGQGSISYYHFTKKAGEAPDTAGQKLAQLKALAGRIFLNTVPTAEYVGVQKGYENLRSVLGLLFKDGIRRESAVPELAPGYPSAATITALEDADHFMLAGYYGDGAYSFSGKLNVLAKVIESKYLLPVMRGKYGAYGANIRFDTSGMLSATAGLGDIDQALEIWKGMGDFLRNLDMTQKELDSVIISVVKEYDQYSDDTQYGAFFAMAGKTLEDLRTTRREMLETTVDDLKGYAEFVEAMVAQNRLFAVLGKEAADQAEFEFPYYGDAATLEVIPRLKKAPGAYFKGKSDRIFAPDASLTRAETAALFARLLVDSRPAQGNPEFSDVAQTDWFYSAVASVTEKQVMRGGEAQNFRPQDPVTRAEFAVTAASFLYEGAQAQVSFVDFDQTHWAYPAVQKMISAGYMKGYEDHTFRPDAPLTRAEAVTILNHMLGIKAHEPGDGTENFEDLDKTHWAYYAILTAVNG